MSLNFTGLIAALTAFLGIWFGHVSVRKIEAISPTLWFPTVLFATMGLLAETLSVTLAATSLKVIFGILGITLLWDALEVIRQEKRVRKGHAPANPLNPRHARILAEPGSHATPTDLLKREPSRY